MTPNQTLTLSLYGRPANPDLIDANPETGLIDSQQQGRRLMFALLAFVVWLVSVGLIVIFPAVFLIPYLMSTGTPLSDSQAVMEFATNDATAILLQLLAIVPAHLLTLLIAWFMITVGWENGGFRWWHHVIALAGFLVVAGVVSSIVPEQENELLRVIRSSRTAVYVISFMAVFTAPIVEEVIYRGILYTAFQRAAGVPTAFVMTTLLFAIVHVPQYYPSWSTIFLLTLLSVILTFVRVRTGNLLPCVVLHTLFNAYMSISLILEPFFGGPEIREKAATALLK
jgi:uncharacterized protein